MITIQGELCDLNTYVNAERGNRFHGSSIKKSETNNVKIQCFSEENSQQKPITKPCRIHFTWYTKDLKKDCDNVAFAKKFVLDGLVKSGIIKNDTRRYIKGFTDDFKVDSDSPRLEINFEL